MPADWSGKVVIREMGPDEFFTAEQIQQLRTLMDKLHEARDAGHELPPDEWAELQKLIDEELDASVRRLDTVMRELNA